MYKRDISNLGNDHTANLHAFKNIVKAYKTIKVSTIKDSITGEELADWLTEVSTPQEIEEMLFMIHCARKRGSEIKSILQTLATALLK